LDENGTLVSDSQPENPHRLQQIVHLFLQNGGIDLIDALTLHAGCIQYLVHDGGGAPDICAIEAAMATSVADSVLVRVPSANKKRPPGCPVGR
jgi:hypothetical protein